MLVLRYLFQQIAKLLALRGAINKLFVLFMSTQIRSLIQN